MKLKQSLRYLKTTSAMFAGLAAAGIGAGSAQAQVTYGTLSNFDVFNDTGEITHGFEIELEGVSSADVTYLFGAPYERYGDPKVVDFPGGVYIRYESAWDPSSGTFMAGTPLAPNPILPTDGHACWNGSGGNYETAGCEHFGLGLMNNPTNTIYRWLVADPTTPGNLRPAGTKVSIPAPIWNVSPAPAGAPNPAPIVQAVIQAPAPEVNFEFGEPYWVKVFVTESPIAAELDKLLTDNPEVPQDAAETEVEWILMQTDINSNSRGELLNAGQIIQGDVSVTRRYEMYEYVGERDPETNEALPLVSDSAPEPNEIGNYLGAQMAAVNLVEAAPVPPIQLNPGPYAEAEVSLPFGDILVSGGVPSFMFTTISGALPRGLSVDALGTIYGTPTAAGTKTWKFSVSDAAGQTASGSAKLTILAKTRITTGALPTGLVNVPYRAQLRAASGKAPYSWALATGVMPAGFTLSPSGLITGSSAVTRSKKIKVSVTDSLGVTVSKSFTLAIK